MTKQSTSSSKLGATRRRSTYRRISTRRKMIPLQPINRNVNPWNNIWLTSESIVQGKTSLRWDVSDIVALWNKQMTPSMTDGGTPASSKTSRIKTLAVRFRLHEVMIWGSTGIGASNNGECIALTAFSLVDPTVDQATELFSPKAIKTIESSTMGQGDLRPARIRYRWPRFHRSMVFDGDIGDVTSPTRTKDFVLFKTLYTNASSTGTIQSQITTHIHISWCWIDVNEFPDSISAKKAFLPSMSGSTSEVDIADHLDDFELT